MYTRKGFFRKTITGVTALFGLSTMGDSCSSPSTVEKTAPPAEEKQPKDCSDLSGIPEQELNKRIQFGYEADASTPERNCASCGLYVAPNQASKCGGCMLFQGPVDAGGSCIQFAAKT
jgi:hypothetical protein